MNKLFFGDCLDVLKKLHQDNPHGFIDLIYIDPPFNSKRNYNILMVFYNYVEAGKEGQAPAMRIGLAKSNMNLEGIVYFNT
jgi:site-specific DNA-methyltransferase (adenine-specific)